jgi:hypothetical protein
MSSMEQPSASYKRAVDPRPSGSVRDESHEDVRHFRSLILPDLVSVPPVPAWLSRLLRRTKPSPR